MTSNYLNQLAFFFFKRILTDVENFDFSFSRDKEKYHTSTNLLNHNYLFGVFNYKIKKEETKITIPLSLKSTIFRELKKDYHSYFFSIPLFECDLLIIDDVHRAASEHFSQIFNNVVYKMILCLTATIKRLDGKEDIIKKYAPVVDTITLEEAEANGWISPVKNYLVLLDVDLTEYNKLNQKFNAYFAYFNYDFNLAMRLVTNWQERTKWARKMGVTPKDATAMAFDWNRALKARKDFIANHPKKLEICQRILNARKDKKCIVFAPTIKVCELVGTDYILHSKCTKKKNSETLAQFNNSSFGSISSSKALTEGVDVKGLSVGIIMNVNSSKITAVQKRGRICRFEPGKKAEMFTLVLKGTQEYQWFQNSNVDSVITIDEEQLNKILNGEEIQTRERESLIDTQFRF